MIGMFIHQQSIDTDADGSININNNNDGNDVGGNNNDDNDENDDNSDNDDDDNDDNSDVGDNHSGSNVDDDSAHLIIDQILAMKEDSDAMACDYKRSLYRYIQNNNIDTNDLINGVGISGRSYLAVRTY